ncbi:MAG: hypothetical protein LH629_08005 [Ignavibacteria bacterium]|nr:hypothetical protein [Ignavibacteria bacterium]
MGYGRFIDGTAMAKAIRIDEDLKKSGVTSKYMPKSTMLKIARIVDKESEYRDRYKAIYESKIIEDISKEVVNSGVSNQTVLSALAYFRIRNVIFGINQFINSRKFGGDIRIGANYTFLTRNKSIETPAPGAEISGRYSYPIDLRQQFDAFASATSPMDSLFAKLITGNAGLSYSLNITNRISFIAGYSINLVQSINPATPRISVSNQFVTAGFNFYLENNILLNIRAAYTKPYGIKQTLSTDVGLTYTLF